MNTIDQLAVFYNKDAIDEHEGNAFGVLQRLVEGGLVDHASGVEDGDVGVSSHAYTPLILERWGALFKALRRHQGHLAERDHQAQSFFVAHVVAKHARKCRLATRMDFRSGYGHAVAGDHDDGIRHVAAAAARTSSRAPGPVLGPSSPS